MLHSICAYSIRKGSEFILFFNVIENSPSTICWKNDSFSLNFLDIFVENQLTVNVEIGGGCVSQFSSIDLSTLNSSATYWKNLRRQHCNKFFKSGNIIPPVVLFKDCFCLFWVFWNFHMSFKISLSVSAKRPVELAHLLSSSENVVSISHSPHPLPFPSILCFLGLVLSGFSYKMVTLVREVLMQTLPVSVCVWDRASMRSVPLAKTGCKSSTEDIHWLERS